MGLAQALAQWTGWRWLTIWLFNSGRDIPALGDDIDLSRTVGSFFEASPVILECSEHATPGQALQAIRKQIHFIPGWGSGYLLIRLLDEAEVDFIAQGVDDVDVALNYWGTMQDTGESTLFRPAEESAGSIDNPQTKFWCAMDCTAYVERGRLIADWRYSDRVFKPATIKRLANDFVRVLRDLAADTMKRTEPASDRAT
jgi:non-ribosomal peptide synthase protein (TIGR01720 family)